MSCAHKFFSWCISMQCMICMQNMQKIAQNEENPDFWIFFTFWLTFQSNHIIFFLFRNMQCMQCMQNMQKIAQNPYFWTFLPVWLTLWSDHPAFMGSNERYGPYELCTQVFFLVCNIQCVNSCNIREKYLKMKKIHII